MKRSRIVTLFFLMAISFVMPKKVDAQIIEVGATGGLSYYIGDINPGKQFSQSDLSLGGVIRYYDNLRWAFRFQYSNMGLNVADKTGFYEPVKEPFKSKINDFSLIAEFNFFDYWTGSERDFVTPYLFAGFSVFNYTTISQMDAAKTLSNGGSFSIPFGVGIKYSLTKRIGLTLEWRMHKSFDDNIDSITDNYYAAESNGEVKQITMPLAYKCDWYSMLGLSVVYRFNLPKRDTCNSGIKTRK